MSFDPTTGEDFHVQMSRKERELREARIRSGELCARCGDWMSAHPKPGCSAEPVERD